MQKKIILTRVPAIMFALLLLASMGVGATLAKYAADKELQGTVSVTAHLGNVALSVPSATHLLIPGYDFTIENGVTITRKSSIAAYTYVEVCENLGPDGLITYEAPSNWIRMNDTTGANGGVIYYYVDPIATDCTLPFSLLVTVSQDLKEAVDANGAPIFPSGNAQFSFYAYLAQTASGEDAEDAYINSFSGGVQ